MCDSFSTRSLRHVWCGEAGGMGRLTVRTYIYIYVIYISMSCFLKMALADSDPCLFSTI